MINKLETSIKSRELIFCSYLDLDDSLLASSDNLNCILIARPSVHDQWLKYKERVMRLIHFLQVYLYDEHVFECGVYKL